MRTSLSVALGLVIAAIITGCPDDPTLEPGQGGGGATTSTGGAGGGGGEELPTKVEILRDELGIPHVFGESEEAAFYGVGYATAQDRLFQMDVHRRYMRGRLAETFGGSGAGLDALVEHDTQMRTLGYARHAEKVIAHADFPAKTRALLEAFAAGVNDYVASEGFALPAEFDKQGIASFEPWQPADSLLVWDRIGDRFNSIGMDQEIKLQNDCRSGVCEVPYCPGPVPIDESAAVVPEAASWPPSAASACFETPGRNTDPLVFKASHGWVVAGSKSASGKPMLALDPKLGITAPSFWYAFHVTTPEYSARGLGLAGAPGFLIFWNENVGQTLTAGGADIADLFQLDVTSAGDAYTVDGVDQPFEVFDETILVKDQAPIVLEVRESSFGPVVTELATGVAPGSEYALRHVELVNESTHSLVGAMEMMGASDMESYRAGLEKWHLPSCNSVFTALDDNEPQGHIGYHVAGSIPWRVSNVVNGVDYGGKHPFDGSTSANDWDGILDANERPHLIDPAQGYIFTANHMAVGSWFDDYAYTGLPGGGDTFRSLQLRYKMDDLLGASGAKVSMDDIHLMHFDATFEGARIYHDILVYLEGQGLIAPPASPSAAANTPEEKAGKAYVAMVEWMANGGEMRHSNPQTPLVNALLSQLPYSIRPVLNPAVGCLYGGGEGGASFFLKSFEADPAGTMSNQDVVDWVIADSAAAWDKVDYLGNDPSAWSAPNPTPDFDVLYQYNQFCPTELVASCSLDPTHDIGVPLDAAFGATIMSSLGSSGTGTVDFADVEGAVQLVPMGASEDPESTSFDSGLEAWLAADAGDPSSTPAAPLSRETIEATAVSTLELSYP